MLREDPYYDTVNDFASFAQKCHTVTLLSLPLCD